MPFSWSTLTASVPAIPVATFEITLPPASIPLVVMLGLPLPKVRPVLFRMLLPAVKVFAVTVSTLRFLFNAKSTTLPVLVTVMLFSPLAVPMSTVSPALIAPVLAPLLSRLKPPCRVVMSPAFLVMFLVLLVTLVLVALSWLPLIASLESLLMSPLATLVILLPATSTLLVVKVGPLVIVRPSLLSKLSPVVTLVNLMFCLTETLTPPSLSVKSMLSPVTKFAVLSSLVRVLTFFPSICVTTDCSALSALPKLALVSLPKATW